MLENDVYWEKKLRKFQFNFLDYFKKIEAQAKKWFSYKKPCNLLSYHNLKTSDLCFKYVNGTASVFQSLIKFYPIHGSSKR